LKNLTRAGAFVNALGPDGKPLWQQYAYIINFDTNKIGNSFL
jgi:hypothetical protein